MTDSCYIKSLLSKIIVGQKLSGKVFRRGAKARPDQRCASARECLIFEVCRPQQAKKVLEENMSISTMLPCRISLYEEGGKTILASLKSHWNWRPRANHFGGRS